ncbi:MAG: transcriptional repressor [Nitrospirota bacterium]
MRRRYEEMTTVLRMTKQREIILEALEEASHPSAETIYADVRKRLPHISLGTVYRNLRQLKETGDISELQCSGEYSRFDSNLSRHYHVTCSICGRILDIDIDPASLKEMEEEVGKKTGFDISSHCVGFHGICKDCKG